MTKEVTMYTIICDRCGKDACEGTDYSGWDCIEGVRESACEGWLHADGKDYCCECVEWNHDESELVPKMVDAARNSIAVDVGGDLRTMVLTEKEQEALDVSHAQEWLQRMWVTTKDGRLMCACSEDTAWTLVQYHRHTTQAK
jgi:hypothetical protein